MAPLKYEYKLVHTFELSVGFRNSKKAESDKDYKDRMEAWLNELGEDGWELCMHGSSHLTFKRLKDW